MPLKRQIAKQRIASTGRIPASLLRWLTGEISDDEAFSIEPPEPASIVAPYGVPGQWDGFDNFSLSTGFDELFDANPGLREELGDIFAGVGRTPPWEASR